MSCRVAVFSPDDSIPRKLMGIGEVVWVPLIALEPIPGSSTEFLKALNRCRVVSFLSPRTIKILINDAEKAGVKQSVIDELRKAVIAVIGEATKRSVIEVIGREPDVVSPKPYTEELMRYLKNLGYGCAVLLRSYSDSTHYSGIDRESFNVIEVYVYRYRVNKQGIETVKELVNNAIDVFALTSRLVSRIFCESIYMEYSRTGKRFPVVALGKTTAMELKCVDNPLTADGTIESFVNLIKQACSSRLEHV